MAQVHAQAPARSTLDKPARTRTIVVLTVGQSPRPDGLARDIQAVVGPNVRIIERGALDGLAREQIASMGPKGDEYRLITMLNDGTSVQLSKRAVLSLLQTQITDLEENGDVDATLVMCTGEFPKFEHSRPLLLPQEALYGAVIGLAGDGRVGDLTPLETQLDQARHKWSEMGIDDLALADANPYCDDPIAAVAAGAAKVREAGGTVLFMDCFGYDLEMKAAAQQAFGGPVILARSMAARLIAEIVG